MVEPEYWGLIGRMKAMPGKRDELIAALKDSSREVPGKLVYLIQLEQGDPDAFWINEIWESKAAYDDCLTLPQVLKGMELCRPLLAGIEHRTETIPLGLP